MYKFSQRSLLNLKGIHPYLVHVMCEAIRNSPHDFTITGGVRTTKEQQALYAQGRTKPGKIVTNADGVRSKSNHQAKEDGFGYAIDLYPFVNGQVDVNDTKNLLPAIGEHIKEVGRRLGYNIAWGGDWKGFVDRPHFELIGLK